MTPVASVRTIKILHTVVWAFFVGCIVAIPIFGLIRRFGAAAALVLIVLMEVIILVANHLQCPLTAVAARYTEDRSPNFDIYLPAWVARYNKVIFGPLFLAGTLFTLARWAGWFD